MNDSRRTPPPGDRNTERELGTGSESSRRLSLFPGQGDRRIDLNADLGEGFPHDVELIGIVSSVSVCCGEHAGDPASIRRTLLAAARQGVVVGAHPGYPDREGFGRRPLDMNADQVETLILEQVAALRKYADEAECRIRFLKPHGALYNQAQREEPVARGVVAAALALDLPLLGQPGTPLQGYASQAGVWFIPEGFPDRRSRDDGSLVPRSEPGAVLREAVEIEAQALRLVAEQRVETLCIHGDEPEAVSNANLVRSALERERILIRGFLS